MNKEKQEIKEITNEIDTTMFGGNYKNSGIEAFTEIFASTTMGVLSGFGIAALTHIPENIPVFSTIGGFIGFTLGFWGSKDTKENVYKDYEFAYLNLPREKQIEVLKLSKKLFDLYKRELQKERNKKSINKYLQISNKGTMFDDFENDHPQFKLLTKEEIESIHKKGKLTPVEKFNEWRRLNFCPDSCGFSLRCNDYETCRDCTVALANEKKEWDKMEIVPVEFVSTFKDDYEQLRFKDTKETVKRKIKRA